MSPRKADQRPELLCIGCSGGEADANGASTLCALCLLGFDATTPEPAGVAAPAPIRRRRKHPELLCIHCSGGRMGANGAHTVCALCLADEEMTLPAAA